MLLDIEPGDPGSNSIDLEDEFNFDRRVERKGVDADCVIGNLSANDRMPFEHFVNIICVCKILASVCKCSRA